MKLPDGWCEAPLEQLAESSLGKMLDKGKRTSGTPLPYLRNINVRWGEVDLTELYEMPFEDRELERYGLRQGDVLICEGGEPGRCAVWPGSDRRIMYQKAIHRVRPYGELLDGQYLQLHIRDSAMTQELDALFTGTTIKHLTGTSLAKYVLRLPPLNEQRRIVDKIEALTARSRRAKEALDAVPALLDKLRQSILAAAFRGDLTKEWRAAHPDVEPASVLLDRIRKERRARWEEAELAKMRAKGSLPKDDKWKSKYVEPEPVNTDDLPELPEGWAWATLDTAIVYLDQGWSPACEASPRTSEDEWAVMKTTAVQHNRFDEGENKRLPRELEARPETELRAGDILITRAGPRVRAGVCCRVDSVRPRLMACDKVYRFRVAEPIVLGEYIELFLNSPVALDELEQMKTGISESGVNLTQSKFKAMAVPVAPTIEQRRLVELARTSVRVVDDFSAGLVEQTELLARLDSAILAKAFRGELVPQDPNDEPASALLERIRAERESAVTTTPTKKTRAKRATKTSKRASG